MSTRQAASVSVLRAEEILDLTIAQAGEAGRDDLICRLSDARRLLVDPAVRAHPGEDPQQGATSILFALDQLTEMLRFRQSRLIQHGRVAQARAAARLAEERTETLRGRTTRWQKMLHDSFATITSDVDFDLRQRMQAVLTEADQAIERGDPATSCVLEVHLQRRATLPSTQVLGPVPQPWGDDGQADIADSLALRCISTPTAAPGACLRALLTASRQQK